MLQLKWIAGDFNYLALDSILLGIHFASIDVEFPIIFLSMNAFTRNDTASVSLTSFREMDDHSCYFREISLLE